MSKRMAKIWIENKHEYIPYELPEGAALYEVDMDQIVQCAHCGREVRYGDCYTSRTIHNDYGLGYAVCEDCYYQFDTPQIEKKVEEVAEEEGELDDEI